MNDRTVELRNLVKIFQGPGGEEIRAVDGVSLVIEPGEMVTLLGPSGCGKTTILRMLAGFEQPTSGQILLGGQDLTNVAPNARNTAMVFQSYALFPHMTVADNIGYGLRFRKVDKDEAQRRVARMMELVGLKGFEKRMPGQLSGGQQQRVALARALVVEPELLLFDEPLSNLDAKLRESMRNEIRAIQQRLGITAVYVTHDQSEAMALSDRIVVMNKGRIEQVGTPETIYRRPATRFVADFVGKVSFLRGQVVGRSGRETVIRVQDLTVSVADLPAEVNGAVDLVCRPEALFLTDGPGLLGTITRATYLGQTIEYAIRLNSGEEVIVTEANPRPGTVRAQGDQVTVGFHPESLHALPA